MRSDIMPTLGWVLVGSILQVGLTGGSDRIMCWSLGVTFASMLAAAAELSASTNEIDFPLTHTVAPVPAKPMAMLARVIVRGLGMAGLLVGWVPTLQHPSQTLLLWWHVAAAADITRHVPVKWVALQPALALAHAVLRPEETGHASMILALFVPLWWAMSFWGDEEISTLWTQRAKHKLRGWSTVVCAAVSGSMFLLYSSGETEATWPTLMGCVVSLILVIRVSVISPLISEQHVGSAGRWATTQLCAAVLAIHERATPRSLFLVILVGCHIYLEYAVVLRKGTGLPVTTPDSVSVDADNSPPSMLRDGGPATTGD